MSEIGPGGDPAVTAASLESEMNAELDALAARGPAPGSRVRNPVFQHEQAAGTVVQGAEATLTAARSTGEMAAEADQERLKIEAEAARIERAEPGSPAATDAEAVRAQAERDADQAVDESLDSDEAADGARSAEGTRYLHRGAEPAAVVADVQRALADESVAGRDLADLDGLEARVEADARGLPPAES
jgi:hypothetical protein